MKLNNKGFAITAVLYGLLILFVILIGSYLTILSSKKNRQDIITEDIEKQYEFKNKEEVNQEITYPYKAPYTGKYVFESNCIKYLSKGKSYNSEDINCSNTLKEIYYGDNNE